MLETSWCLLLVSVHFSAGSEKEKEVMCFWKFQQIIGFLWEGRCIQMSLVLLPSSCYALLMQSLDQGKENKWEGRKQIFSFFFYLVIFHSSSLCPVTFFFILTTTKKPVRNVWSCWITANHHSQKLLHLKITAHFNERGLFCTFLKSTKFK